MNTILICIIFFDYDIAGDSFSTPLYMAKGKNISRSASAKKKPSSVKQTYTTQRMSAPVDIESILLDYQEVPKDKWGMIQLGSFIKYLKADGTFVKGGVVQVISTDSLGDVRISIRASYGTPPPTWVLNTKTVQKIWIKRIQERQERQESGEMQQQKKSIEDLTAKVIGLSSDVVQLKAELKRVVNILEKMNRR